MHGKGGWRVCAEGAAGQELVALGGGGGHPGMPRRGQEGGRAAASLWISSLKNHEKLIKQGPIMQKISLNRTEYMQANYSFSVLEFGRSGGQLPPRNF